MANQITGKIEVIYPVNVMKKKSGDGTFSKREMVLDITGFDPYTGEKKGYDNYAKIEFTGDRIKELDAYQRGEVVTVSFDLQGSKIQDPQDGSIRYITNVKGYKIERRQRTVGCQTYTQQAPQQYQQTPQQPYQQPMSNELPW